MAGPDDWGRRQQAAREKWSEPMPSGKRYKIRVPDDIDLRRIMRAGDDLDEAMVLRHVIDWKDVTEADIAPGVGGEEPVPFSPFTWREWIGSRQRDFEALVNLFVVEVQARQAKFAGIAEK